jgi:AAA domain
VTHLGPEASAPLTDAERTRLNGHAAPDRDNDDPGECLMPVPEQADPPPPRLLKSGNRRCDQRHDYRDGLRRLLGCTLRFEARDGKRKFFLPLTYWAAADGKNEWRRTTWPKGRRPLFGLDKLAARPNAKVLLVEGEKTANALEFGPLADAFKWCGEDVVAVTWSGGGSAEKYADFMPLKGRDVTIVPDDHQPGEETADELVKILRAVGVRRLCRWKAPPEANQAKAEGWDIADEIPPGWEPEALVENILAAPEVNAEQRDDAPEDFTAKWHGDADLGSSRPWLVYGIIPEVGVGLLAGQWGTYKTFVAIDLACAVMSGTMIFDSDVDRRGGVLLYAAEGENEVAVRLQAAIENRCPEVKERAPFVWLTPKKTTLNLLDAYSVTKFITYAKQVDAEMRKRFNLPLALIVVDTVVATAGFKKSGEENDAVLGARLMKDGLGEIARQTKAFALGVDHFGKTAETGTRGSSGKEDNADVVLAALGEKSVAGLVTNPRLAVRKTRGGVAGREFAFTTRPVGTGKLDPKQRPITTLAIDWSDGPNASSSPKVKRQQWPKALRLLHRALSNVLADLGTDQRPYADGPMVRAVNKEALRSEFYKTYPADGDTEEKRRAASRKAFNRAVKDAQASDLICIREIGNTQQVWFARARREGEEHG